MRITNSMMIDNMLRDLNSGMSTVSKYSSQLAANRKITKLSDNPIGVLNSQNARRQLYTIKQYQANITSANSWVAQVETAMSDIMNVVTSIKEAVIDASGTKTNDDKKNIGTLVKELMNHLMSTCNSAVGDKYIFAGYNATKMPFQRMDDGTVLYNGINLYDQKAVIGSAFAPTAPVQTMEWTGEVSRKGDFAISSAGDVLTFSDAKTGEVFTKTVSADDISKGYLDMTNQGMGVIRWTDNGTVPTTSEIASAVVTAGSVTTNLYKNMTQPVTKTPMPVTTATVSIDSWGGTITKIDKFDIQVQGDTLIFKGSSGQVMAQHTVTPAELAAGKIDLSASGLGEISLTDLGSATPADVAQAIGSLEFVTTKVGEESTQEIKFEVAYGIKFNVTFTGIDVVGTGENNMFKILNDLVNDLNSGASNEKISTYLTKLTSIQERILTNTVELGARTTRLETMTNRYSLDLINAEAIRTGVEDIDQAEVIMNYKFSESIYRQALAAGAQIIQPTLMDFLR